MSSCLRVWASLVHTNALWPSALYEPFCYYISLIFFPSYIKPHQFCISLCSISQLFSLKLNYQGHSLLPLVLLSFHFILLPTYLLVTPLFIPQDIFCILLCSTCQLFSSKFNYYVLPMPYFIRF